MKIDEKKTLGFIIEKNDKIKNFIKKNFDYINDTFKFNFDRTPYFNKLFVENEAKQFYVTKSAIDLIAKIDTNKLDYELLFNKLDNNSAYKFIVTDSIFVGLIITKNGMVDVHFYEYVYNKGEKRSISGFNFIYDYINDVMYTTPTKNKDEDEDKKITAKAFGFLLSLLTYYCYSDTEFKFVESKKKIGTRKKGYKNNTNYDFTIIDSVWNNIIVRKEGFNVSGHLRLQPCGIQSMDRKLIWITEHKKHGYVRGLKKIL